jgi:hypothetical protein
MNQKKAKLLRKMARQMSGPNPQNNNEAMPDRRLMVRPEHEKRAKFQKSMQGIQAVNHPQTGRGVYRWLKKNADA